MPDLGRPSACMACDRHPRTACSAVHTSYSTRLAGINRPHATGVSMTCTPAHANLECTTTSSRQQTTYHCGRAALLVGLSTLDVASCSLLGPYVACGSVCLHGERSKVHAASLYVASCAVHVASHASRKSSFSSMRRPAHAHLAVQRGRSYMCARVLVHQTDHGPREKMMSRLLSTHV